MDELHLVDQAPRAAEPRRTDRDSMTGRLVGGERNRKGMAVATRWTESVVGSCRVVWTVVLVANCTAAGGSRSSLGAIDDEYGGESWGGRGEV